MKVKELEGKSISELEKLLLSKRDKLRDLRFKASAKQLKNYHEIKLEKKDIARILMIMKNIYSLVS